MKPLIGSFIGLVLSVSVGAEPLLEGRVSLSSGQPAAGVQVRLFDLDRSAPVRRHDHGRDRAFRAAAASILYGKEHGAADRFCAGAELSQSVQSFHYGSGWLGLWIDRFGRGVGRLCEPGLSGESRSGGHYG